ncbi:uncharacterized protein LOC124327709 [Daphnia pulicaria]|uniref:uncharacterized protein LOC124327709 n=1 Tax=Daphnia pulicaria TaxID=35523 RepID=UPI001EEBCF20|nr:uncharacterized protein LOC124327709 [Daphnia pulicaria]
MPEVSPVFSLYSQCLYVIQDNLEHIYRPTPKLETGSSCSISEISYGESDNNPFHKIPTVLLEEIICSFPQEKKLKNFNIGFLITPELQQLIIPSLCRYSNYNEQYLNFRKLEKLQVLVMQKTNVGDSCLKMIGTWCKNLRVLDVNYCSRVTDTGIEWLILQSSELRNTLRQLLISCRSVTKKGTKMAIQHFSALEFIENRNIFDVLVEVVKSAARIQPKIVKFPFLRLKMHPAALYRKGNFGLVVGCCPGLLDLTIVVKKGLTDSELFCLTNLKILRMLNITGLKRSRGDAITFDMGIAPVLKVVGNSLKVLHLPHFEVDIWTIVKYCPNLNSLIFQKHCESLSALSESEVIQLRNEKGRVIFEDLQFILCGYNLSNDILFALLSCPSLEKVVISDCNALTDEFLQEAMKNGILKNLQLRMPKVSPVFSLFSQCLYIIKNNLEHIYPTPVKSVKKRLKLETSTSSCSIPQTTVGESDNNPFHKIPTVLLEQIISSLHKKMKNFDIGFLITTELKKLIIPNLCNEQYLNFRKLETLQGIGCKLLL